MRSGHIQFVLTPFLPRNRPALGISNLISVLRSAGYRTTAHYLNIDFAKQIGSDLSWFIEESFNGDLLLGEMIFTPALWGSAAPPWADYEPSRKQIMSGYLQYLSFKDLGEITSKLRYITERSPLVIDYWADFLLKKKPDVIAFSTTFQQTIASLALAKRIKEKAPTTPPYVIFGGANCEGDMGKALADNFPFIDTVVSGEGEGVILDVIEGLLVEKPLNRYIFGRAVQDMDSLPLPDFSDYFSALEGDAGLGTVQLVVEASRGCWWGAKSHCTFCGLNGSSIAYRSKSPERFTDELDELRDLYKRDAFLLTDNILDMSYFKNVFPKLASDGEGFPPFLRNQSQSKSGSNRHDGAGWSYLDTAGYRKP